MLIIFSKFGMVV